MEISPDKQAQRSAREVNRLMITARFIRAAITSLFILTWIELDFPARLLHVLFSRMSIYASIAISVVMFFLLFFVIQLFEELFLIQVRIRFGLLAIPFRRMMFLSVITYLVEVSLVSVTAWLFFYFVDLGLSSITRSINHIVVHNTPSQIAFVLFSTFVLAFCIVAMNQPIPEHIRNRILMVKNKKVTEGSLFEKLNNLADRVQLKLPPIIVKSSGIVGENYNAGWQTSFLSHKVILGEGLLHDLCEDDVVAIVSHEIGHGLHKHNSKKRWASYLYNVVGFLLITFLFFVAGLINGQLAPLSIGLPALVLFYLTYHYFAAIIWLIPLSKKQELIADRCAIALGSSRENYARALIAITDIALIEYKSMWIDWLFLSDHPSVEKRVKLILGADYHKITMTK